MYFQSSILKVYKKLFWPILDQILIPVYQMLDHS